MQDELCNMAWSIHWNDFQNCPEIDVFAVIFTLAGLNYFKPFHIIFYFNVIFLYAFIQ